ncbi:MAG: hypothetical protein AAGK97_09585, partial [Bacteroidota bacterium]
MSKRILLLLILSYCIQTLVEAQRTCSTMELLQEQLNQKPELRDKMDAIERKTQSFIQNQSNSRNADIITIPVVVHVVYNHSGENISEAQI